MQTGALAIARFARKRLPPPPPPDPYVPHYAVHLAVALGAATLLERALALHNGYWVPMTALLVLRPDNRHTMTRAFTRVGGTIGGAALASGVLVLLNPAPALLAILVCVASFGSYLFQKASYGLLSACVTAYVVFILSLAGAAEKEVALARIIATTLGGAVALAVQWIDWVAWRRHRAPRTAS